MYVEAPKNTNAITIEKNKVTKFPFGIVSSLKTAPEIVRVKNISAARIPTFRIIASGEETLEWIKSIIYIIQK